MRKPGTTARRGRMSVPWGLPPFGRTKRCKPSADHGSASVVRPTPGQLRGPPSDRGAEPIPGQPTPGWPAGGRTSTGAYAPVSRDFPLGMRSRGSRRLGGSLALQAPDAKDVGARRRRACGPMTRPSSPIIARAVSESPGPALRVGDAHATDLRRPGAGLFRSRAACVVGLEDGGVGQAGQDRRLQSERPTPPILPQPCRRRDTA